MSAQPSFLQSATAVLFAVIVIAGGVAQAQTSAADMPARFVAGRVLLDGETRRGEPVVFFTDTGGGRYVTREAVARLDLVVEAAEAGDAARYPELSTGSAIAPLPRLAVGVVDHGRPGQAPSALFDHDAMLGALWFADRIWTFDFPRGRLTREAADWTPPAGLVVLPLTFQTRDDQRTTHFPRVVAQIDGQPVPLLFDTGATTLLSQNALAALDDNGPALRATSMISEARFETWRAAHPEWRVVEDAQIGSSAPMIEVPSLTLGGVTLGPVWFTRRPDDAFHTFMSGMMDQPVEGALGGNAFAGRTFTLDYPAARMVIHH